MHSALWSLKNMNITAINQTLDTHLYLHVHDNSLMEPLPKGVPPLLLLYSIDSAPTGPPAGQGLHLLDSLLGHGRLYQDYYLNTDSEGSFSEIPTYPLLDTVKDGIGCRLEAPQLL